LNEALFLPLQAEDGIHMQSAVAQFVVADFREEETARLSMVVDWAHVNNVAVQVLHVLTTICYAQPSFECTKEVSYP
jgi:hypothetical protein